MKHFQLFTALLAVVLLLGVAIGPALAQEELPPEGGTDDISLQGTVDYAITYQGSLARGGVPVNGTPDMTFRLYSDANCTAIISGNLSASDVPVVDGFFSIDLPFQPSYYNGQGLWVRVTVDGTAVACQELLPVPYALSLRPGADIIGTVDEILVLENTFTGAGDYDTLIVRNHSTSGEAVEIGAVNTALYAQSSGGYGVIGVSTSTAGAGVVARGKGGGFDLVIGGDADSDDGIITSDPDYASSDLFFFANDGIVFRLDKDGGGEQSDFDIRDKDNTLRFRVDEGGEVTFGGAGIAAFPRPAYDSGWVALVAPGNSTLTHSLGGSVDNYVVDLMCKKTSGYGISNFGHGADMTDSEYFGAWYSNLTTTQVTLHRWDDDQDCPSVRVRIWMYP